MQPRTERVGGAEIPPGTRSEVLIGDAEAPGRGVPAVVWVSRTRGPRVTVAGAPRGFEAAAALALDDLCRALTPDQIAGTLVVVPVLRPGGRLSRHGRPLVPLALPGDAGGGRRARLALALHGDLVVAAESLFVLSAPRPGLSSALTASGRLDEPRTRRLLHACGVFALVDLEAPAGSILQSAHAHGRPAIVLSVATGDLDVDRAVLAGALRRALEAAGVLRPTTRSRKHGKSRPAPPAVVVKRRLEIEARGPGRLEDVVAAGRLVRKGATLARITPLGASPHGASGALIVAPRTGVVLSAPLYRIVAARPAQVVLGLARGDLSHVPPPEPPAPPKIGVGWVERVSLPRLGLRGVQAKIDTGARTSALHVLSTRPRRVPKSQRPMLEVVLPGRGPRAGRTLVLAVREYVDVRDTSGRTERRPVVETQLALGPVRKRIRLTLTNRGDMRYPMLVGRTALGGDVVVDPSRRFLLDLWEAGDEGAAPIARRKKTREI